MTHRDLIDIAYKWVLGRSCGVAFKELNTMAINGEYPDVIGFGSNNHSILIEVKISRNDFFADKKKLFRMYPEMGMGRYRFFCVPEKLVTVDELPNNWGLIYVNSNGKAKCIHNPYTKLPDSNIYSNGFDCNIRAEHMLMYSALRRLHIRGRIEEIYIKVKSNGRNKKPE